MVTHYRGYEVVDVNAEKLTIDWKYWVGMTVPANTGLLMMAESGVEDNLVIIDSQALAANDLELNMMKGSVDESTVTLDDSYTYYQLDNTQAEPTFVKAESSLTNEARNAYLVVPTTEGLKDSYGLTSDSISTGVEEVASDETSSVIEGIYNIQGVRLPDNATLTPGFYIINGKKTLIR